MSTSRRSSSPSSNCSNSSNSSRSYKPRYSPPRPSSSSSAPTLEAGGVFNLPSLDICKACHYDVDGIEEGIFNHPVLLLSAEEKYACVLVTSSLDNKSLKDYHPKERHVQMEHIPMLPAEPHHITKELLKFENGLEMPRPCYVKIRETHRVPLACLKPYQVGEKHQHLRLCAESLADLHWARSHTDLERSLSTRRSSSLLPSPVPSPVTLPANPVRHRATSAACDPPVPSWRARRTSSTPRQLNENWRRSDPLPRQEGSERRLGFGPHGNWRQEVNG